MMEFRNMNDVKFIKVVFDEYEKSFLLESKLTARGIKTKVAKSLLNESIFKVPKEIIVIPADEVKEKEVVGEEVRVNSYTSIGIHVKWDLHKNIKPVVKTQEIFLILNHFDAFHNNYEIYFKSFGVIQFINHRLNLNVEFKNSEELYDFLKKHFNIVGIDRNVIKFI
ncbi:MAG: hypothetical protein ACRCZO_13570 [Cetobacterium sp.]